MKIIVSFSGGKDSQACLIQAANKYGADKIEAVFCDTGWEHPDTYQHISNVCKQLDVRLVILRSKKYTDFVDMSIKRSRFPSSQRRFCTSELKIKPMIDYILSLTESCLIIQGIRAKESEERAKLPYECNYFGEYFERVKKNRKGKVIEVWKHGEQRGITFKIGRSTLADANKRRQEAIFEVIYHDLLPLADIFFPRMYQAPDGFMAVRITLMYYVDFYSLFNNPEKEWDIILSKAFDAPSEPSLFD